MRDYLNNIPKKCYEIISVLIVVVIKTFNRNIFIGRNFGVSNIRNSVSERTLETSKESRVINESKVIIQDEDSEQRIPQMSFRCISATPDFTNLKNVFYSPVFRCLYTADGLRIDSSFIWSRRQEIPKIIAIPKDLKIVDTEFLYIGDIEHFHYGHFLIESISHLWGLVDYASHPIMYAGYFWTAGTINSRLRMKYLDDFFKLIGMRRNRLYCFHHPVLLRSVILPNPSLVFGKKIHKVHNHFPEIAARNLFSLTGGVVPSSQPAYFSRTRLRQKFREMHNEIELEKRLATKGVKIIFPETLTLAQQIMIVNRHKYLIGCQGSALHNVLFSLNSDAGIFCLTSKETWIDTFYMVDWVKNLKSKYILALDQVAVASNSEWTKDKVIDVNFAIEQLESCGII